MVVATPETIALEVGDMRVGHGGRTLLSCDHLTLHHGEIVALIGASGTGKTTFFSALAGHSEALHGRFSSRGDEVSREWLRQRVARTLQSFPLLHWLTVESNLRLVSRLRGLSYQPEELLEQVSARHLQHRWPHTLSGGERCRVSLAMCLLSKPEVLLLDEPFNGLDILLKKEVADSIFRFVQQQGCATMLVTHDLEDALRYADRVAVIRRGQPSRLEDICAVTEPNVREKILSSLN